MQRATSVLAGLTVSTLILGAAHAAPLIDENWESQAVGLRPAGWSINPIEATMPASMAGVQYENGSDGNKVFRFAMTGQDNATVGSWNVSKTVAAADRFTSTFYESFDVKFPSISSQDWSVDVTGSNTTGGPPIRVRFRPSSTTAAFVVTGAVTTTLLPSAAADTWYKVEIQADLVTDKFSVSVTPAGGTKVTQGDLAFLNADQTYLGTSTFKRIGTTNAFEVNAMIDNVVVAASPVPEPAALSLLGLGGLSLMVRRQRRN